jgi:co-chaperonin GroES (HSP10)
VKALTEYVVLEQVNAQETTESGFILTGGSENKQLQIKSIGSTIPVDIAAKLTLDSRVYINWVKANKVRHNSKDYVIVHYTDILALI